jgi:hypothetical protein
VVLVSSCRQWLHLIAFAVCGQALEVNAIPSDAGQHSCSMMLSKCVQERVVTLVAGWLLDTNNPAKMGHGASQEYKANLEQNLSDAVARIPKLTTGTVALPLACHAVNRTCLTATQV